VERGGSIECVIVCDKVEECVMKSRREEVLSVIVWRLLINVSLAICERIEACL
jgi:hypothetical protein